MYGFCCILSNACRGAYASVRRHSYRNTNQISYCSVILILKVEVSNEIEDEACCSARYVKGNGL